MRLRLGSIRLSILLQWEAGLRTRAFSRHKVADKQHTDAPDVAHKHVTEHGGESSSTRQSKAIAIPHRRQTSRWQAPSQIYCWRVCRTPLRCQCEVPRIPDAETAFAEALRQGPLMFIYIPVRLRAADGRGHRGRRWQRVY